MDPENETPGDAAGTIEAPAPPAPSDQADGSASPTVVQSAEEPEAAPTDVTPAEATTADRAPDAATGAPAAEGDPVDEAPILPPQEIRAVLEALVFASPQPITSREITQVMQGVPKSAWLEAFEEIKADYARDGRGLQVIEIAGGYQITTRPEYNDWVRQLLDPKPTARLSIQALETLAVIAYKQPVTQPEVIELRGVKSGGVLKTLLEKRLIKIVGRKEVVGRPILYGTTKFFLLHFGLKDLSELPKIEEFAEVLGEEVDVEGLKKAIEAPRPVEVPLSEAESDEAAAPGDESADEETTPAPTESEG
jgi:segregation and condensation protein B